MDRSARFLARGRCPSGEQGCQWFRLPSWLRGRLLLSACAGVAAACAKISSDGGAMKAWNDKLRLRHAMWRLQRRGIGYSRRDLARLSRGDVVLLWKFMRGPSGLSMLVGAFYGILLGLALAVALVPFLVEWWGYSGYLYAVIVFAVTLALCWGGAMYVSDRVSRRGDPFYGYVRRCRSLIWVEGWPARSLGSRRALATLVIAWEEEADLKCVRADSIRRRLEILVDRNSLSRADVRQVGDLAREAALLPFRGEVNIRSLASRIALANRGWRVRRVARHVSTRLVTVAGLVTALVAPVLAFKELLG